MHRNWNWNWNRIRFRTRTPIGFLGLLIALVGCSGQDDVNRSPLSSEDQARFERAQQQAEDVLRANREAEQAAMRGANAPEPEPSGQPD